MTYNLTKALNSLITTCNHSTGLGNMRRHLARVGLCIVDPPPLIDLATHGFIKKAGRVEEAHHGFPSRHSKRYKDLVPRRALREYKGRRSKLICPSPAQMRVWSRSPCGHPRRQMLMFWPMRSGSTRSMCAVLILLSAASSHTTQRPPIQRFAIGSSHTALTQTALR
jgi:ribosomal protein S30